jgi:diguanylate cyclase (GGDEF)-like protein
LKGSGLHVLNLQSDRGELGEASFHFSFLERCGVMRILLIEDDVVLADVLSQSLTSQHYVVDVAEDGEVGQIFASSTDYDLILMDVELPKINGITLCQQLRSQNCKAPILLITGNAASTERIRGLDAGADDYLSKPLDLAELQARVRALLRRTDASRSPVLEIGALRLDPSRCQVTYDGQLLGLTPKEYRLLELFLRNPARVFSRGNIIEHLWTFDDPPQEESVKSHIKGLRQKLRAVGAIDWIENVYGLGYRLKADLNASINASSINASKTEPSPIPASPLSAPVSPPIEQQFNQAVDTLWKRYQDLITQRFRTLQQAATAAQTQSLSPELRQTAEQEAHKLAGVLGMFNRESGSAIAHQIEQLLHSPEILQPAEAQQLLSWTQQLGQIVQINETEPADEVAIAPADPLSQLQSAYPTSASSVKVLVVDDDPAFLATLYPMLTPWGIAMTGLDDVSLFWRVLQSVSPDLLILDVEMPYVSGIELCQAVRANAHWGGLPILFLTAHRDIDTIQQVLAAGADDYVVKPVVGAELLTRITNRLERTRLLQTLSTKDPLTGLANQPHSSRDLDQLIQQVEADRQPLSLIILCVTNLRQVNVQYGHAMGNQVLQFCGRLLEAAFPQPAVLGYWGNGEFIVGLPQVAQAEAIDRLLTPLQTMRQQIFTTPDAEQFQVTCQEAIAVYPFDGLTVRSLYRYALERGK